MKVAIFGANGAIGQQFIGIALRNGHQVNAFIRNEGALTVEHPHLNIIVGQTTDKEQMIKAINHADTVISTMGPPLNKDKDLSQLPITMAHQLILEIMEENNIKRLITLGTPAIKADEDKHQLVTLLPAFMAKNLIPKGYAEMKGIEKLMRNSSLDWTVIRIVNPNVKINGKGYDVTFGDKRGRFNVSRFNVALAMHDAMYKDNWIHKMPIVFNR